MVFQFRKGPNFSFVKFASKAHVTVKWGRVQLFFAHTPAVATAVSLVFILLSIVLFPYRTTVQRFNIPKKGEVARETIIAPFNFDIIKSSEELDRDRRDAMDEVLLVFDLDKEKTKNVHQKFFELRLALDSLRSMTFSDSIKAPVFARLKKTLSEKTLQVIKQKPFLLDEVAMQAEKTIDQGIISILLVSNTQRLQQLQARFNNAFENHLFYNYQFITIRQDSTEFTDKYADIVVKPQAIEQIILYLKTEKQFDQEALNCSYELLETYLVPNLMLNGAETTQRRLKASQAILLTKGKVLKNSEIVRAHQEITNEIVEKLVSLHIALESQEQGKETLHILQTNIGTISLIGIMIIVVGFYILRFHRQLIEKPKHLLALVCVVIFQIAIIRLSLLLLPKLFDTLLESQELMPELMVPTSCVAMLTTLLFGFPLSIAATLLTSLYFSLSLSFSNMFFMYSLIGGFVAGFASRSIRYRSDFFKILPPHIAISFIMIFLFQLMNHQLVLMPLLQNFGVGLINSILTIIISLIAVVAFEYLFDISTNMTLIELSDMNHPLLKRLSIEAAGTYNHSVLVANLAESAAQLVGANPLVARVASYYHDVGKINKPHYFVENQRHEKNIHDKLSPRLSALVIGSHVKDGIHLAKKYRLPGIIGQAILQHHGTSNISFFYEKAVEQDPKHKINEIEFRYSGPRPQSKENAIIMLADSVEAASRSLSTSSPKMLRALTKKILHDKFAAGQLDECDLTFRDLDKIIEGFMPVLQGMFHTRIEYPQKRIKTSI